MQNHKSVAQKMAQVLQFKTLQNMLHCFSALHFLYNVLICKHGSTHSPFSKNDWISSTLAKSPLHPPKKGPNSSTLPPFLMEVFAPSIF